MDKRKMSVCFADLNNFRLLVDTLGIEKTYENLQEAFLVAGDKIVQHGGVIRKYIGDTILFSFDDPHDAVAAANEIAGYLNEVGDMTLRFNVGVATGEVATVVLGHPSLLVVDILGKTVNRAAILSREAGKGSSGVALCEETKKLVGEKEWKKV
jgi:class 3 adenylate cyclase